VSEEPRKRTIRLELTPCQKQQIRQATGREVNRLELQVEAVPETADLPAPSRSGGRESAPDATPRYGPPRGRAESA
jgi:hypothetical protein